MAIEAEHRVLVIDALVLAPDVPEGAEFYDKNCFQWLKKHWTGISSFKRQRLSVRNTEICMAFNISMS